MMKFLGFALLVLVCISVVCVDGRKDKRGRKDHHGHLEARRADSKRMREAQQTKKSNVGEPTHDNAAPKQVKVTQESSNDVKGHLAKKEKRGHRKHEAHHIGREDKFKRNHARHPHYKEDHKRHNGKRPHPNDSRMMKKEKMSREMLIDHDLPIDVHKRMMKIIRKDAKHRKRLERMNHSRE